MAEGFARTYGSDVLQAHSAGLAPAMAVAPLTHKVMLEKNIDVGHMYPKDFKSAATKADLIINMSGMELPVRAAFRWRIGRSGIRSAKAKRFIAECAMR